MTGGMKSQSAMEYLMTYGWAIVAVAVALGVLYSLGIFSFGANSSKGCAVIEGFSCTKPILYSSGALTMQFGLVGTAKAITATGCSANNTEPSQWKNANVILGSGQVVNLSFYCPGVQGSKLGSLFTETLWIQYTSASGGSGSSGGESTVTQQVAVIRVPISGGGIGPYVYLATANAGIYVIDASIENVVATIPTGDTTAESIAYNPSSGLAYVANGDGTVTVISVAMNKTVSTIAVPGINPTTILYDAANSRLYVTGYTGADAITPVGTGGTVSALSGVSTGYSNGAALSPSGTDIYFVEAGAIQDYRISDGGLTYLSIPALSGSYGGVAVSSSGLIYVTDPSANKVSVVTSSGSGGSFTLINTITVGTYPVFAFFSPSGASAYVINSNDGTVSFINVASSSVVGSPVPDGNSAYFGGLDPTGSLLYLPDGGGGSTVNVIYVATRSSVGLIQLPSSSAGPGAVGFIH